LAKKIFCVKYKGGKCENCGWKPKNIHDYCCLDFHHVNPSKKLFEISKASKYAWDIIKLELDKCQLLCSSCHRKLHLTLTRYDKKDVEKSEWISNIHLDTSTEFKWCSACKQKLPINHFRSYTRNVCDICFRMKRKIAYHAKSTKSKKNAITHKSKKSAGINRRKSLQFQECKIMSSEDYRARKRRYQATYRKKHFPDTKPHVDIKETDGLVWCPGCEKYKNKCDFYKSAHSIHGTSSYCRVCAKERALNRHYGAG
jgi:hypothetical protein